MLAPANARILLGPNQAEDVEEHCILGRLRRLIGSPFALDVGSCLHLRQQRRICPKGRYLTEEEDGPVFRSVVCTVGEHVLGEEAAVASHRQLLLPSGACSEQKVEHALLICACWCRVLVLDGAALVDIEFGQEDILDLG